VSTRIALCALFLLAPLAHGDLKWASTTVFTAAAPSESRANAQFTFINTGTYPIKITGTRTTCGCTAAIADDHLIAPGQTGKIDVSFKTLSRHGLYEEPITVETNDPKNLETTIVLRALIRDAVQLLPTLLFWQSGEPLAPKVIRITVTDGFHVKDVTATCPNPDIQLNLTPVKPGSEYTLTVTPKAPHIKAAISVTPQSSDHPVHVLTAHIRVS
jgi:hypothetical protein